MTLTYRFDNEAWMPDFFYCYSPAAKSRTRFLNSREHVNNSYNPTIGDYDYVSVLYKDKLSDGAKLRAVASFKASGAPCIVVSNDIVTDKCGHSQYGVHFELVAYEGGFNVWHIAPWPERVERPIKSTLLLSLPFKIESKSKVEMELAVQGGSFIVSVNGHSGVAKHKDIPKSFYAGITACEGLTHFYELCIE